MLVLTPQKALLLLNCEPIVKVFLKTSNFSLERLYINRRKFLSISTNSEFSLTETTFYSTKYPHTQRNGNMNNISGKVRLFTTKKPFAPDGSMANSLKVLPKSSSVSFGGVINPATMNAFERWGYYLSQKVPKNFYNSKFLDYIARMAKDYPGLFEALTALGVTCTIRPITIMAMPGAKQEDKQYAAVKSVASGIVGYGLSLLAFKPLGDIVKKLGEGGYDHILKHPFPYKYGTPQFNTFSFITNYGAKFLLALPMAIATFKLIPVMMDKLFPNRNKKPIDNYNAPIAAANLNDGQKLALNNFMQTTQNNRRVG